MDKTIRINDSTFHKVECTGDEVLTIQIQKGIHAVLYIESVSMNKTKLHIELEEEANLNLLMWNESSTSHLDCVVNLQRNSSCLATFGEMSDGDVEARVVFNLTGEGSRVDVRSASIVNSKKEFDFECIHHAPHTVGIMENYAVVRMNGKYKMVDTGKIVKGAFDSSSHQTTRVLTMSEKQVAEVTPLLLIDENDVQASHATTLGQPDENQLYYLQTRGLSREEALGLITIGYLMPIANAIDNEELNKELTHKIEMKAGISCLM